MGRGNVVVHLGLARVRARQVAEAVRAVPEVAGDVDGLPRAQQGEGEVSRRSTCCWRKADVRIAQAGRSQRSKRLGTLAEAAPESARGQRAVVPRHEARPATHRGCAGGSRRTSLTPAGRAGCRASWGGGRRATGRRRRGTCVRTRRSPRGRARGACTGRSRRSCSLRRRSGTARPTPVRLGRLGREERKGRTRSSVSSARVPSTRAVRWKAHLCRATPGRRRPSARRAGACAFCSWCLRRRRTSRTGRPSRAAGSRWPPAEAMPRRTATARLPVDRRGSERRSAASRESAHRTRAATWTHDRPRGPCESARAGVGPRAVVSPRRSQPALLSTSVQPAQVSIQLTAAPASDLLKRRNGARAASPVAAARAIGRAPLHFLYFCARAGAARAGACVDDFRTAGRRSERSRRASSELSPSNPCPALPAPPPLPASPLP